MESPSLSPELLRIVDAGVPEEALVFHGRWWQFETWLREVAYVELRAKYGGAWTEHLEGSAPKRAATEAANAYMASADAGELLAYADVSDLFGLIADHWPIFEPMLPPQRRWQGRTDELRDLRNRNAHCRRPHRDDLGRILQTLRDLEDGAWRFYTSYLRSRRLAKGDSADPLAKAWADGQHETARRLLKHAEEQYETRFRLCYSVRPWANRPDKNAVSGSEGVLWHAHWTMGGRDLDLSELWRELERRGVRQLLIHLLVDLGRVTATFAAVDAPAAVGDAIGVVFDELLHASSPYGATSLDDWEGRWTRGVEQLPRVVLANSPLTILDSDQAQCSIFGAG
jgi:hypothetical protein